mmetsp:Transcript_3651/g.8658  ORF Transcript_3651/g.8658 Transcript_3651/m.8658 type:complete len:386 (-) Transcript_3651:75-1232(-)
MRRIWEANERHMREFQNKSRLLKGPDWKKRVPPLPSELEGVAKMQREKASQDPELQSLRRDSEGSATGRSLSQSRSSCCDDDPDAEAVGSRLENLTIGSDIEGIPPHRGYFESGNPNRPPKMIYRVSEEDPYLLHGWKKIKVPVEGMGNAPLNKDDLLNGKFSGTTESSDSDVNNDNACFTHVVCMLIKDVKDSIVLGWIQIGLYGLVVPKTVENFIQLSMGTYHSKKNGIRLQYKGTSFHRIMPGQFIQGGDIHGPDGYGGESIYGDHFEDECFKLKHVGKYIVAMANRGRPDSNNSQFYIMMRNKMPKMDGRNVVFGKVIGGTEILDEMGNYGTSTGEPHKSYEIEACGLQWSWDMIPVHPNTNLTWHDLCVQKGSYIEEVVD